jgi:hypothetical protein
MMNFHELYTTGERTSEYIRLYFGALPPAQRRQATVEFLHGMDFWKDYPEIVIPILIENGLSLTRFKCTNEIWYQLIGAPAIVKCLLENGVLPRQFPPDVLLTLGDEFSKLVPNPWLLRRAGRGKFTSFWENPSTICSFELFKTTGISDLDAAVLSGSVVELEKALVADAHPEFKHLVEAGMAGYRDVTERLVAALDLLNKPKTDALMVIVDPSTTAEDLIPFGVKKSKKLRKIAQTLGREDLLAVL